MSVLINIDMPPNCESCPLRMEYDDESFCPFDHDPINYWIAAGRRSEKCSLVEMSDGHGKWEAYMYDEKYFFANYCSECKFYLPYGIDWKPNFCPNCGADMR